MLMDVGTPWHSIRLHVQQTPLPRKHLLEKCQALDAAYHFITILYEVCFRYVHDLPKAGMLKYYEPMPHVLYLMSYTLCPMSYVPCLMSHVLCPIPYVLCLISYIKYFCL